MERRLSNPSVEPDSAAGRLREAMRYAALGPGKRLRPALALAACTAVGRGRESALPAAAAVELLHAYTLVHDDLPCMDDDDERRGRPTVHVAFGEATAVLVGDALLTEAFAVLAALEAGTADAVRVLAQRTGADELLAGQARDLAMVGQERTMGFDEIEALHAAKTGALFSAATELGGIAGGASAADRQALARYGMAIGIAFQHADDRDDGDFPQHAEIARQRMKALTGEAATLARGFGAPGQVLLAVADWIGSRA